ncbi:MAG: NACHT domain-containing protein [Xenococcus sp. (in: cyanobacteria)]
MILNDNDVAKRRIAKFEDKFGKPHLYFAYHAAFPLVLTPDLLYCLWQTFQRNVQNEVIGIPWIAVANILLSNLCQEVDSELYEMDLAIRQELLRRLRDDNKFGEDRIRQLSKFLIEYTEQQLRLNSDDPDIQEFAKAQRWSALAYTDPDYAARELAANYREVMLSVASSNSRKRAELMRLEAFLEASSEPFQAERFKSLRVYGHSMADFARGKIDSAAAQLQEVTDREGQIRIKNVILPVPELIKNTRPDFQRSRPPLTQEEYRNRQALLSKVKDFWVEGVLKQSVHNRMLIELNLEERPDALESSHWGLAWNLPHQQGQNLPPGTKVIDQLDELGTGRRLLILGEPGSGKTITLLELARDLIARAEEDGQQPIPVVFNLSSWTDKKQSIYKWIIEELFAKYQVPRKTGEKWLKEEWLLLLLDDLDEVHLNRRDLCVAAINHFSQEYAPEIVVCSRIRDYEILSNKLSFQGAIVLQPLTSKQVDRYLENYGQDFAGLRQLIQEDRAFQELTKSPLLLNIMMLAYQGSSPEELHKKTSGELREKLFNSYIDRMLERRQKNKLTYSKKQIIHYLSWLAKNMSQASQTVFLIEGLQPTWLEKFYQNRLYLFGVIEVIVMIIWMIPLSAFIIHDSWIFALSFMPLGPITGLLIWLFLKLFSRYPSEMKTSFRLIKGIFSGLSLAIASGIAYEFSSSGASDLVESILNMLGFFAFPLSLIFVIIFELIKENIHPVKSLKWSWKKVREKLLLGLIFGVLFAAFMIVILILTDNSADESFLVLVKNLILIGASIGAFYGIFNGFEEGIKVEKSATPNLGIWQSAAQAGVFIVILGLIGLLISFFLLFFLGDISDSDSLFTVLSWGLIGGGMVGGGLMGAAGSGIICIQHFILRLIMWRSGYIPWNYARFLDYATECNLLQKVGGGYIFIHRLLLEHFAQLSYSSKK